MKKKPIAMKILLTGFQSFGPYSFNPTEKSAENWNGRIILGDRQIFGLKLPCTYYGAFEVLAEAILRHKPDAVVSTGLSSIVRGIRLETTFHNVMNGKYADVDGFKPQNVPVMEDQSPSITSNGPYKEIYELLAGNNIPVELSINADTFICNSLGYQTANFIATEHLNVKHLFLHIPWTSDYLQHDSNIVIDEGKIVLDTHVYYKALKLILATI